ncbi:FAD-dependent thymidylate synthase [Corynebacterium choanae]|uniref:Flavin-dependent thymidylate synthase n=1 Tax=Corynebacterium choanae TaxID=1862358 RepID=A0A3G6J7K1_9CORY|nr:FAD-dependent thymidylate synthase [Corynebacterium choanae]AZA13802.1 Thymidylate synthase ThyX [Corynebacterium choanae]
MATHSSLSVQLIASTEFHPPVDIPFSTSAPGGQAVAEFAGRACYESFDKPNPRTATNEAYLRHILEVGHMAVLEHASATFYVRGISRSLTQEFVRHRHLSFSQLSQRFVHDGPDAHVVIPEVIAQDPVLTQLFDQVCDDARFAFTELLEALEDRFAGEPNALLRRKQARQAARAVLPNCTESRVVVTGNYRAWRHFLGMRATEHADPEMRNLAVEILRQLQKVAPVVFADFEITTLSDGTVMASSPYVNDY